MLKVVRLHAVGRRCRVVPNSVLINAEVRVEACESRWTLRLYQQVDVAARMRFAASDRTEDVKRGRG